MRFIVFALLAGAAVTAASEVQGPNHVCEPGKVFMESCNMCICSVDGTRAACTFIACPIESNKNAPINEASKVPASGFREKREISDDDGEKSICEPGKLFKDDCNTCRCSKDGKSAACTLMFCSSEYDEDDSTMEIRERRDTEKKFCEPGKILKRGCNDCICHPDGTRAWCTMRACPSYDDENEESRNDVSAENELAREKREMSGDAKKKICKPGKIFLSECNSCLCSTDGTRAWCTLKACPSYDDENEESEIDPLTRAKLAREKRNVEPARICEPGKSFKKFCNSCACSKDGTSAACTKMYCAPGLFNEDGSINHIGSDEFNPMLI